MSKKTFKQKSSATRLTRICFNFFFFDVSTWLYTRIVRFSEIPKPLFECVRPQKSYGFERVDNRKKRIISKWIALNTPMKSYYCYYFFIHRKRAVIVLTIHNTLQRMKKKTYRCWSLRRRRRRWRWRPLFGGVCEGGRDRVGERTGISGLLIFSLS